MQARDEKPRTCLTCGGTYIFGGMRCAAIHREGECCHYYSRCVVHGLIGCERVCEKCEPVRVANDVDWSTLARNN